MTARRGVIVHAGDVDSCDLADQAQTILRAKGWAIRKIDRSRTRRFADTLFVTTAGAWHNCRLVEVNLAGEPISAPIPIKIKRVLQPGVRAAPAATPALAPQEVPNADQ